ncbi:hypothetical protein F511_38752 [Dorcoceras hygrometricum]|uniref:Uncharacterized protein n=1 Tax=Dorcoceras hygrometricum TaxID=472368 RepID=A0A2Z7CL61_9LAMI|nr:hypothetical protein F511_38752 [Dorcoceras hygrometricum]
MFPTNETWYFASQMLVLNSGGLILILTAQSKEGSSIDQQVTIYLHAQNITMFPTNETWYFASQMLVLNSGGLILILTAQSTRNMFRIHMEPSTAQLGESDSLQTELSKLNIENDLLRTKSCELSSENEILSQVMSSWTKSYVSLGKLHETQKSLNDKSGLGFCFGESSSEETSTQSDLADDKFKKMNFFKASAINDAYESVKYDDQISRQLNHKGKTGIGYINPENSKPSWLTNRLEKDKAKAGPNSSVLNQQRRGSTKAKYLVGSVRVCLLVVQLRVDVNDGQLYCSLRLVSCSLRLVLREGYRPDLMTSAMRRRFIKLERSVLMQRLGTQVLQLVVVLIQLVVPQEQAAQVSRPAINGAHSSQSSQSVHQPQQQVAQQSGRQRFRSRGQQFKKKSGSGSFGSGSSSSSGSRAEFCGFCGGKHPSMQCVGVQGSCNLCGQYENFARVCPSAGSQQTAAQPQGRGGQSRGRSPQLQQPRLGETQYRPFQQPGPSRFEQSSQPFFSGPQHAQVNAITREQAEATPSRLAAGIARGLSTGFDDVSYATPFYKLGSVRVFLLVVQLRVDVNDGQLYCSLRLISCSLRLVSCSLRLVLREGYRPDLMTSAMRRRFIRVHVETESRIDVSAITNYDAEISSKVLSNEEGPLVEKEKEKDKDKGKRVVQMLDSTDTEPLSKVLELTELSTSDEESMSIDYILAQIPEDMMLPSVIAAEPTKIIWPRD